MSDYYFHHHQFHHQPSYMSPDTSVQPQNPYAGYHAQQPDHQPPLPDPEYPYQYDLPQPRQPEIMEWQSSAYPPPPDPAPPYSTPPVQPQPDPDPLYNQPPYSGAAMRPLDNHQPDYQQPRNGHQPPRPDYPPPHTDFQHHPIRALDQQPSYPQDGQRHPQHHPYQARQPTSWDPPWLRQTTAYQQPSSYEPDMYSPPPPSCWDPPWMRTQQGYSTYDQPTPYPATEYHGHQPEYQPPQVQNQYAHDAHNARHFGGFQQPRSPDYNFYGQPTDPYYRPDEYPQPPPTYGPARAYQPYTQSSHADRQPYAWQQPPSYHHRQYDLPLPAQPDHPPNTLPPPTQRSPPTGSIPTYTASAIAPAATTPSRSCPEQPADELQPLFRPMSLCLSAIAPMPSAAPILEFSIVDEAIQEAQPLQGQVHVAQILNVASMPKVQPTPSNEAVMQSLPANDPEMPILDEGRIDELPPIDVIEEEDGSIEEVKKVVVSFAARAPSQDVFEICWVKKGGVHTDEVSAEMLANATLSPTHSRDLFDKALLAE